MVQERLRAAGRLPQNQGDIQRAGLKLIQEVIRTHGIVDPGPKEQPVKKSSRKKETRASAELDLKAEWQRQSQNFLRLGFHIERGFPDTDEGKQAYLATLPRFEAQPKEYQGRADMPMLIEKEIPWRKQAELAGIDISDYLQGRVDKVTVWQGNHSKAPDVSYASWFNKWGQVFPDAISPFEARKQLAADLAGADPFEGIDYEIHFSPTASSKYFDLIGSQVGSGLVVRLCRWLGRPGLDALDGDGADPLWRPLVRGSKVVTR